MGNVVLTVKTKKNELNIVKKGSKFYAVINGKELDGGAYDDAWHDIRLFIEQSFNHNAKCNVEAGFLSIPPDCYSQLVDKFGTRSANKYLYELAGKTADEIGHKLSTV